MAEIAAIILSAGRATRFGADREGSKLLAPLGGKPLVRWAAEAALASRARPVMVVTGHAGVAVRAALGPLDVTCVENPDYRDGMAGSLRVGLAALPADVAGVLVLLGDMPRVTAAVLDHLIDAFAPIEAVDAVVPSVSGRPGNPVLLGRALFPALAGLTGDVGARHILARPDVRVRSCAVDDEAIFADVDTIAALAALAERA